MTAAPIGSSGLDGTLPGAAELLEALGTRGWSVAVAESLTGGMVIASLIGLAHFSGAPPDSTYVPAHIENGRLVPGVEK